MRSGARYGVFALLLSACAVSTLDRGNPRQTATMAVVNGSEEGSADASAPTAPRRLPRREAAPADLVWETSDATATERARRASLPEIVWLRAEWSPASLTMERTTWKDPAVANAARVFVALRLDLTEAEGDAERLRERYDVQGLPTVVLIDARGRRAATLRGFVSAAELTAALTAAAEE